MTDRSSRESDAARTRLRSVQRRYPQKQLDLMPRLPYDVAEQQLKDLMSSAIRSGDRLRIGPFTYPAALEELRWRKTAQILRRVNPGPDENGARFAAVAREAATLEVLLTERSSSGVVNKALDRVIIGTTGQPTSEAITDHVNQVAIITMSAGMMALMDAMARAVVMCRKIIPPRPGTLAGLAFSTNVVRTRLDEAPWLIDDIVNVLIDWIFHGKLRGPSNREPEVGYLYALGLMRDYVQRFAIAHEYGHALAHIQRVPLWPQFFRNHEDPRQRELECDRFATWCVSDTAAQFDNVGPNIALQAAILEIKAHEIAGRAIAIALESPRESDSGTVTHPPPAMRIEGIIETYSSLIAGADDPRLDIETIRQPDECVELLWERIESRIKNHVAGGGRPHEMWEGDQPASILISTKETDLTGHGPKAWDTTQDPAWARTVSQWPWVEWNDAGGPAEGWKKSGKCPTCGDSIVLYQRIVYSLHAPLTQGVPVGCNCNQSHPGRPDTVEFSGCGQSAKISPAGSAPAIMTQEPLPPTQKAWNDAADAIEITQLDRLRAMAEKWGTTVTALLGLFVTVAVITGTDSISGVPDKFRWLPIGLVILAGIMAGTSILKAAQASQGPDPTPNAVWNGDALRAQVQKRLPVAQKQLKISRNTGLIAASLVFLLGTFTLANAAAQHPGEAKDNVLLIDADGTLSCGELNVDSAGRVTVGGVTPHRISSIVKVANC